MPTLPSGRIVAMGVEKLDTLLENAKKKPNTNKLMNIHSSKDLWAYISIVELHESNDPKLQGVDEIMDGLKPMDTCLVKKNDGFTLNHIKSHTEDWCNEDKNALKYFAFSDKAERYYEYLFSKVIAARQKQLIN